MSSITVSLKVLMCICVLISSMRYLGRRKLLLETCSEMSCLHPSVLTLD